MKRLGVLVASIGLVLAVWLSLAVAQRSADRSAERVPAAPIDLGDVPGFRSDAWYLPDDSLLGFVEIPGGPFLMGSDPVSDPASFDVEWWSPRGGRGTIDVPTFYIGRYEVTIAQYAAFVSATARAVADEQILRGRPDLPVVGVTWTDAVAYGRWLEDRLRSWSGTPPEIARRLAAGWHVGLPTEAQWEKAARGPDGRIFPWGDTPRADRANFGASRPSPVGTYGCPECPWDVADMAGNVWEWTRSPYQPYPYDEADDRDDVESEALWVMRGGSFGDPPRHVRAANRGGADPGARRPFLGFRVALTPP